MPTIRAENRDRYKQFAAMFSEGKTLQEIGTAFGVSREFVRQVLKKYFNVTGIHGGASARKRQASTLKLYEANKRSVEKWGHNVSEHKSLKAIGKIMALQGVSRERQPIGAYTRQRQNARERGIPWELTLAAWWHLWLASGHWNDRGRGAGSYVMRRRDEAGPYSAANVVITNKENDASPDFRRVYSETELLDGDIRHQSETDLVRVDDSYWENKGHFGWLQSERKRS